MGRFDDYDRDDLPGARSETHFDGYWERDRIASPVGALLAQHNINPAKGGPCRDCGTPLLPVWRGEWWCGNCRRSSTPGVAGTDLEPHTHPLQYLPGPAWAGVRRAVLDELVAELDGCAAHEIGLRLGRVDRLAKCAWCRRVHVRAGFFVCRDCGIAVAEVGMATCFGCRPPAARRAS